MVKLLNKTLFNLLIGIFILCLNSSSRDNFNEEIKQNNQRIRELYESDIKFNIEIDEIQKKLTELTSEIDIREQIVAQHDDQINSLEKEIYDLNNQIESLNNEICELENNMYKNEQAINLKREEVNKFKQVIDNRIKNLYKNLDTYSTPLIKMFYSSENISDYIDKIIDMNKFIQIDKYTLEKVVKGIEEIDLRNKNIEVSKRLIDEKIQMLNENISKNNQNLNQLEKQKQQKEQELNEISRLVEELNNQYKNLSSDKLSIHDEIVKLYEDNEKLKDEQKKYMEELNKQNKKAKSDVKYGKYIKPVPGKITSRFGKRVHPITGKESSHTGIDIASPMGEGVKASLGGEVVSAGWYSGVYGNVVIINHGNNIQTFYGHLSKVLVKKGEKVRQGDIIGKVGSTGASTGPHLHFEIYVNGERVDPERRISK